MISLSYPNFARRVPVFFSAQRCNRQQMDLWNNRTVVQEQTLLNQISILVPT
jgi:hypothetical protein